MSKPFKADTANITTDNVTTANDATANITTGNITSETVGTSGITTANITTANITTANAGNANVTATTQTFDLTVTDVATIATENVATSNITNANVTNATIQALTILGVLSPADIGGTIANNYAPAGIGGAVGIIRLTSSSPAIITGLSALGNGREVILYSLPTNAGSITLNSEDVGSTAANRFTLPGAANVTMSAGSAVLLRYDSTLARWAAIAIPAATGSANLVVTGSVTFSSTITPASLAADQNNYAPAGLSTTQQIRQAVNTSVIASITGLTAQAAGRRLTIENLGPGTLQLTNEDANSTAANRFTLPGAGSWQMLPGGAITVLYDSTSARWRVEDLTNCSPFQQITGVTSPATISGTINDYAPTGLATSGIVRQTLTGTAILTGLVAQGAGRIIFLENVDTTFSMTLNNEDLNSAAANRFTLPGAGAVLMPPGASVILSYDGTSSRWRPIGQIGATATASTPFLGQFGTGSDGDLVFDGVATVLGMVPAANVYTLSRDLTARNMTINAGVTLRQNNGQAYRLFWTGTFLINGTLSAAGFDSTNSVGVSAGGSGYFDVTSGGGGGAGTSGGGAGPSANISASSPTILSASVINSPAINTAGTSGAANTGQGGTGGGGSVSVAGSVASMSALPTTQGTIFTYSVLSTGRYTGSAGPASSGALSIFLGGYAGSGGGGLSTNSGGGGGGAGGAFILCGNTLGGSGLITVKGGNGGPGSAVVNPNGTGGGGGGGGGTIILLYLNGIVPTTNVLGGTGGAGSGTGGAGGNGAAGRVIVVNS